LDRASSVASPKIWGGGKMFDFRRIALFCLEKRISKHKMTKFSKYLGAGMAPLPPPGYASGSRDFFSQCRSGSAPAASPSTVFLHPLLNAKHEIGRATSAVLLVFVITRPGIKPSPPALVVRAQPKVPLSW